MARARAATFGRHGIRQRVVLVVLIGTSALVGALAWLGAAALAGARAGLAAERGRLARALAMHVDRLLEDELQELATLALDDDVAHGTPNAPARLRQGYRRSRLLDALMVLPASGAPLIVEPPDVEPPDAPMLRAALQAGRSGRPSLASASGSASALLLVPIRDDGGRLVGVVAGRLRHDHPVLQRVLTAAAPVPGGWAEVRDAHGQVRALGGAPPVTEPGRALLEAEAPVGELGWTVLVAQTDADALASLYRIRWIALGAIPALFAVAVLLAWGAAESVVKPLAQLTGAAEAIARGDLEQPIPAAGVGDEAGRLAHALDHMRLALKQRERDRIRGELLKRTLSAQEDERKRIARELHDETSQTINALLMKLDAGLARYPSDFTRARIADARDLAGRLLEGVHRLIFALRPSMLDDLGLASAIEWFARRQLEPLGVSVTFEAAGTDRRLARETELAIFRAAQEAITNIGRHAGAEHALVQYVADADRFVLEVEDDGSGFEPTSLEPDGASMRGLGLAGMRERIGLVGGRLTIDSATGSGTRVVIEVPLVAGSREAQHG